MQLVLLLKSESSGKIVVPAFIGFVIYLFNPATLWFQCNTYMSDMLVQVFFITTIYFALKLILSENQKTKCLFFISLFLMIYTSWLGVFLALTLIFYGFKKQNKKLMLFSILAIVFAVGLTFFQYLQIEGYDALKEQFFNRMV